ncbi:hypothetical protein [Myroides injenensis]|uniref:hypothetical protein n=1 Tax=Myroides injenensis TaxID=1183151 RepID=UPI0002897662|nr:hypothetical protein [Myroides injenensis]
MEKQYDLNKRTLILKVKPAPIFIRFLLFLLAVLGFILPLTGIIASFFIVSRAITVGHLMIFLALLFVSLFIFRLALWNTKGKEEFYFGEHQIEYQPDYGWFKDKRKKYVVTNNKVSFEIKPIGYESDRKGVLIMQSANKIIGSAVKLPIDDLGAIIAKLKPLYN